MASYLGNMTPLVSNFSLCHTICFVIVNSSTGLVEHFMGMLRPKGCSSCLSNYERHVSFHLDFQRTPDGASSLLSQVLEAAPSLLDPWLASRASVSPWALPGDGKKLKVLPNSTNIATKLRETDVANKWRGSIYG